MPSRSRTCSAEEIPNKSNSGVKNTKVKEKLQINVTKDSAPEDILHASWKFLSVCQFFIIFKVFFKLPNSFNIETLEKLLLDQHESSTCEFSQANTPTMLADFMVQIISPISKQKVTLENYQQQLLKLFPESRSQFSELTLLEKIKILKIIEDVYLETQNETLKNEKSSESLRIDALGSDHEGWTYWYFGDSRLYREIPIPNGKRGAGMINSTEFTFELICSTAQEWHQIIKKFQSSNKVLATKICEIGLKVISDLEARETNRLRNEAKLLKAKEMELMPKKRSRRLEAKHEEETKKQKLLEIEREQNELEGYKRKKQQKEEKIAAEQEKKEISVEEARLKNEVHDYIADLISKKFETDLNLKLLKNQLSKKSTEADRLAKMQGWAKLLVDDIHVDVVNKDEICFIGENLDEALSYSLLKNILRIYLSTVMKYKLDPYSKEYLQFNQIYKDLLLNKYKHMNAFSDSLNKTLGASDEDVREYAVTLLTAIFQDKSMQK